MEDTSVNADVKTAVNTLITQIAQTVILTVPKDVKKDTINAVDVTKLDETTSPKKSEYLIKLSEIVEDTSVNADVQNTANAQIAQTVMLTEPKNVKKDTINAVDVTKLNDTTSPKKSDYLTKLSDIVQNAHNADVKTTANAQIVMLTEDINVTPEMINAVDVTKLDDTTSHTKADYVKKLSDIVNNTSVKADVKNTANAQIAQTVILTDPKEVQKNTINAVDVTKLDETTSPKKSEYLIKLSEIVEDTSVNADVKTAVNTLITQIAQTVILTVPKDVKKDTINAVDVTKLDDTTKANYVKKLSNIATNASVDINVKTAANAQIVIAKKNTDVTQAMINAVDVTKLESVTRYKYLAKLPNIVKNSTVSDVKTAALLVLNNYVKYHYLNTSNNTLSFSDFSLKYKSIETTQPSSINSTPSSENVFVISNDSKKIYYYNDKKYIEIDI